MKPMVKKQPEIHLARVLFVLVLSATAIPAGAQDYPNLADAPGAKADRNAKWYRACMKVKDVQPPKRDLPSADLVASLGECDAVDLYYDTQDKPGATQADWNKVRACAMSGGDTAVLTMLYANGYGVKFSLPLALHYACSGNGMAIDPRDVVEDMMDLRASARPPVPPYDICDNAVAPQARIECAQIDEEITDHADTRKLEAMSRNWPANQKKALAALRAAAMAYADAWGEEADQAVLADESEPPDALGKERVRLKALFMHDVAAAEKGALPHYTRAEFNGLNKELLEAYRESQLPETMQGGPDPTIVALRKTQGAWLKYRDAWVTFGKLRYPRVPGYSWKAMLTERRLEQLEEEDDTGD